MIINKNGCKIVPFPKERNVVLNVSKEAARKHNVYGFGEIDVTQSRKYINEIKEKTGEELSFTAFIVFCVAKAVDDYKEVHAIKVRKKLYIFDEVDCSTIIERELPNGKNIIRTLVIRNVNKKTYKQINDEIRSAQKAIIHGVLLGGSKEARKVSIFEKLPGIIRRFIWFKMRHDPWFKKNMAGTVNVSAVGMFGTKGGWALAPTLWPVNITVGGIVKRPGVVGDKIEIREYLCITLSVDHDVIDGGVAARFAGRLVNLIESCYGLV